MRSNLSTFLTLRDAWAGSMEELLLDRPRDDCPMHLPDAPAPAGPWAKPPGVTRRRAELERDDERNHAVGVEPRHCSPTAARASGVEGQSCGGDRGMVAEITTKQRNQVRWLASLNGVAKPELRDMTEAASWLEEQWDTFMRNKEYQY